MKIRDIKDEKIRELAIDNCDRGEGYGSELVIAFYWGRTKEGEEFWSDINKGNTPKIQTRELKLEQGILILSLTNLLEV